MRIVGCNEEKSHEVLAEFYVESLRVRAHLRR